MSQAVSFQPHTPCQIAKGSLRRWCVPLAIWLVIVLVGAAVSTLMVRHILDTTTYQTDPNPLAALQPVLGGQTLVIPEGTGLWAYATGGTQWVVLRAHASGETQRINLCTQRTLARDNPFRLYPVALLGSVAALSLPQYHRAARRNPLVVAPEDASGMPALTFFGSASDDPNTSQMFLNVHPTEHTGAWQVAMAGAAVGSGSDKRYAYSRQAWLLWSAASATQNTQTDVRYTRAVHIRTVPQPGCAAGALEWQLLTAEGANAHALARVLVQPLAGADVLTVRLGAGRFQVPDSPALQMEDHALFERAVSQGLIKRQDNGLIAVAPSDLARIKAMGQDTLPWLKGDTPGTAELATVKALHHSDNGQFVLGQIARFNQGQYWLALRLRRLPAAGLSPHNTMEEMWRADAYGESLALSRGLPPVAARLFDVLPVGWSEWLRVAAPKGTPSGEVTLRMPMPLSRHWPNSIELLVLGRLVSAQGAEVIVKEPACLGPACVASDMLQRVQLKPGPTSKELVLTLQPEPRFNALNPVASEQWLVQTRGSGANAKLVWVKPSVSHAHKAQPAVVTIDAREGTPLFDGESATATARQLGLATWVGLSGNHESSLAGSLMRLGSLGDSQVRVRTTIDPVLQRWTNAVLVCVGQQDGHWNPQNQTCDGTSGTVDSRRHANAVVMDASNGDILAAASGVGLPEDVLVDDLIAFDRFNSGASPLRPGMWAHDGGVSYGAGSSFKMVSSLGLEVAAQRNPALLPFLNGATPAQWNAWAADGRQRFRMDSACYPLPCGGKQPYITNFHDARPMDQQVNGRFGVAQALKASVNTWFAMMAERTDGTQRDDNADARPLGAAALHVERPILAMAHRLGFERPLQLDGGLLPEDFPWHPGDYLQTIPSHFDAIDHVHGVRQMALGLRMQTTPLQMARVAAAVATGQIPTPRLMLQLNQREARLPTTLPLGVPLYRVREGMKEVVDAGTARGAFQGAELKLLGEGVFGKTGTAPIWGTDLNSAWFVGYIRPRTWPGEQRTLAFAVQIRYSPLTGGAHAAPVVANLMETLANLSVPLSKAKHP